MRKKKRKKHKLSIKNNMVSNLVALWSARNKKSRRKATEKETV